MSRKSATDGVREAVRQMIYAKRERDQQRETLRRNPLIGRDTLEAHLRDHDRQTAELLSPFMQRARAVVGQVREAIPTGFVHMPKSAQGVNFALGLASLMTHYTPDVFAREIEKAVKAEDRFLLATLQPLAESFSAYKKGFATALSSPLIDMQNCLDNAPELVTMREDAEWASTVDGELNWVETSLAAPDGLSQLSVYNATAALSILPENAGL